MSNPRFYKNPSQLSVVFESRSSWLDREPEPIQTHPVNDEGWLKAVEEVNVRFEQAYWLIYRKV